MTYNLGMRLDIRILSAWAPRGLRRSDSNSSSKWMDTEAAPNNTVPNKEWGLRENSVGKDTVRLTMLANRKHDRHSTSVPNKEAIDTFDIIFVQSSTIRSGSLWLSNKNWIPRRNSCSKSLESHPFRLFGLDRRYHKKIPTALVLAQAVS